MPAFHEIASIFPYMTAAELDGLAEDIKANGLREPIWTYQDKIIDGRNRFNACAKAGVEPQYREWDGNGSLTAFVISLNMQRRHLDESQRAMAGARAKEYFEKEAKERKSATLKKGTENGKNAEKSPLAHKCANGKSSKAAAEATGSSERSVENAAKVINEGTAELAAAVDAGVIPVTAAARITKLAPEEQKQVVEQVRSGESKNVKEAAAKLKPPVDDAGDEIPERLRPHFADAEHFRAILTFQAKIQEHSMMVSRGACGSWFKKDEILKHCSGIYHIVDSSAPRFVCKGCEGSGCSKCRGRGFKAKR